jgi:hypothetical protein
VLYCFLFDVYISHNSQALQWFFFSSCI